MIPVLAIALALQGTPAVDSQPHLLDHALAAPIDDGGGMGEGTVLWRVLGTVGGATLGAVLGGQKAKNPGPDADRVAGITAIGGAVLGGYAGYLVGGLADEGSSGSQFGIGCVCASEFGVALVAFVFAAAFAAAGG